MPPLYERVYMSVRHTCVSILRNKISRIYSNKIAAGTRNCNSEPSAREDSQNSTASASASELCQTCFFSFCKLELATRWSELPRIRLSHCTVGQSNQNTDARPFARSLAPLTCLLAPPYSLCSCAPLRSLACLLAHFTHSLARGKGND